MRGEWAGGPRPFRYRVVAVWDDQTSHDASLDLPSVQQTIAAARPLIAGFGIRAVTAPAGGIGLP